MNKNISLLFLLLLVISFSGCQQQKTSIIMGVADYPATDLSINGESIQLDENGEFIFQKELEHSTILELGLEGDAYEVFLQPGKTVDITVENTPLSLLFSGDLVLENEHLLSDKAINDDVNEYINENWYTIHRKNKEQFIQLIDSLKGIYLKNLETINSEASQDFVEVNQASINYAFDRMILRYPEWHERFTGNKVELNQNRLANTQQQLLNAKFYSLSSYQRYFKYWLNSEIKEKLAMQRSIMATHNLKQPFIFFLSILKIQSCEIFGRLNTLRRILINTLGLMGQNS